MVSYLFSFASQLICAPRRRGGGKSADWWWDGGTRYFKAGKLVNRGRSPGTDPLRSCHVQLCCLFGARRWMLLATWPISAMTAVKQQGWGCQTSGVFATLAQYRQVQRTEPAHKELRLIVYFLFLFWVVPISRKLRGKGVSQVLFLRQRKSHYGVLLTWTRRRSALLSQIRWFASWLRKSLSGIAAAALRGPWRRSGTIAEIPWKNVEDV